MSSNTATLNLRINVDGCEAAKNCAGKTSTALAGVRLAANAAGIGLAALAAGTVAATNDLLRLNAELNTLSQTLNIGRESLQLWQIAGESVGIDADKMGDIFKDVNDKLGDFANTGGGEAVDLIKRLKLDINDLIKLSPDQALLKIADAMGKTKDMSTAEKTFLLEGLADDASRLLPLLENNAEKLGIIRDRASTNLVLITPEQKRILDEANAKMAEIGSSFAGLSHQAGTAGAMIVNAFGSDVANALDATALLVQDLPDMFMQSASDAASAWAFATEDMQGQLVAVGALAGDIGAFIGDTFTAAAEYARLGLTYFPVYAKAAFEAMAAYATAWVLELDANFSRVDAAAYAVFASILDQAAAAFGGMASAGGDAVAFILSRLADMAGGAASALAALSNVPGLENIGAGVQGVEADLRNMAQTASSAGAAVGESLGAAADNMRDHAKAAADAAFNQSHLATQTKLAGLTAIQAAQDFVGMKESQRDINTQIREENQALGGLADGVKKTSDTTQKFHVNQEAVNKALKDGDSAAKSSTAAIDKANAATKAHNDTLKSSIEALQKQRIELEHGKLAAEYYTDRLNGLTDAEARAKAGASQYNSLLAERKRLQQEAAGASGSLVDQYQAHLADIGLDDSAMTGIDAAKSATDKAVVAANQYQAALDAVAESAKNIGATVGQSVGGAIGGSIGGAVTATITKVSGDAAKTAAYAVQKLQSLGWSKNQAIGIAANLQQESKFNASAVGDSGKAYGIAQWHPDRQANFSRAMGKSIRGSSLEDQLAFLTYEMTKGTEKGAGNKLKGADSAAQAAAIVSKYYERPLAQVKEMEHRAGIANGIAKNLGDSIPSFVAVTNASKDIATNTADAATNTATVTNNTQAATVQAAEYSGTFDAARVTAKDTGDLLKDHLNAEMGKLVDAAQLQTKQAALTGEELRKQELKTLEIGDARAAIILQEEQLANYTQERVKLDEDAASVRNGMAAQYTDELKKQNLSQQQIADLISRKMTGETAKLLKNAEDTHQELLLTPAAYQAMTMAADGFSQQQIAQVQHAEKLNEELKRIRETADKVGDDLLTAFTNAALGGEDAFKGLQQTLTDSFAALVLKPTIEPITKAVSAGINGTLTGQANPWAGLQQQMSQTWSSLQQGGMQGYASAAGVGATIGGLTGSQEGAIGGALGSMAGKAIGTALGGPIGGAIGSVIGSAAGAALGDMFKDDDSARAKFTGGAPTDGFVNRAGNKLSATSTLGTFGFQEDGTHDLGDSGEKELAALVLRMANIDDAVAKFMPVTEVQRVKQALADYQHTGTDVDAIVKDRLKIISTGLSAGLQSLIDFSGDADSVVARLDELLTIQQQAVPALSRMNLQLGSTADAALMAATGLSDAAGGLSNLTNLASAYYDAVYSEEEQKQIALRTAQQAIDAYNTSNGAQLTSLASLRTYVEGLDLTTAAGRDASLAAMGLADELKLLAGSAVAGTSDLDSANAKLADQQAIFGLFSDGLSDITSGLDDQLRTLEATYADQIRAYGEAQDAASGLRDALQSLKTGDLTTLVPVKQLEAARAEFERLQRAAKGGDIDAAGKLESAGETLLRLSREYNASSEDYSADFAAVSRGWESIAGILEDQSDPQQDMLAAQRKLIDQAASQAAQLAAVYGGILGGNTLLDLMGKNIDSLPPDIAIALKAVIAGLNPPTEPPPTTLTIAEYKAKALDDVSKLTDPTAIVLSLYPLLLNRAAEPEGQKYWVDQLKSGVKLEDLISRFVDAAVEKGEWAKVHPNSHATGLDYVPYDDYKASLHKGEAVIDAASMNAMRKYGIPLRSQASGGNIVVNVDMQALVNKVESLTAEVRALRSERSQDAQSAMQQRSTHIKQSGNAERGVIRAVKMRGGK
ncbi:MAG: hypothetical protein BWK73_13910 [Thiothrix lacustris]|uniref:Phage tail lysozyme domain-containing protein n=1 Tax=Thiothrix lacustris TaxID=525917 RepID=A0A1Y1QSI3_9GAMM|nr:MAG: hypothetical protein BWK73_13910 [Thiothrix lacustris]